MNPTVLLINLIIIYLAVAALFIYLWVKSIIIIYDREKDGGELRQWMLITILFGFPGIAYYYIQKAEKPRSRRMEFTLDGPLEL
ncbi:MAG: hypothetical protein ACMUIE_00765 [Thermoplasmatota archaeon]